MDARSMPYSRNPNVCGNGNSVYNGQAVPRLPHGQGYNLQHSAPDMNPLAYGFHGLNVNGHYQPKHGVSHAGPGPYAGPNLNGGIASMYGVAGQYGYPAMFSPATAQLAGVYTQHPAHCVPPLNYQQYHPHDNSPLSQSWTTATATVAEVPTLITPRRDSLSSNENDQPSTPSYAGFAGFGHNGVIINRSSSGVFTQSTPSPSSMVPPYGVHAPKRMEIGETSPRIKLLINKEPAIPEAIPAPSSPLKPLDRALENQRGETNVYIRGLRPETTDEQLEAWGARFGDIKSSKSIIDMNTGRCKGFGFVKYHNYDDAENCIRGFHYLGYEVSFARESFYSKLKTFADEKNTNLYVSNLPKSMNEHELATLFTPHKVYSTRILRDHKSGHGRGVGFARFDTRETCEEIIKSFSNHTIESNGEELQMQIRYADTQEQKTLKQQTQAARQFRSAEYEFATQAWRPPISIVTSNDPQQVTRDNLNEFEQYLGAHTTESTRGRRWSPASVEPVSKRNSVTTPYSDDQTGEGHSDEVTPAGIETAKKMTGRASSQSPVSSNARDLLIEFPSKPQSTK